MSLALPTVALSVRQPWAWAIIHAEKNIENRSWYARHPARRYRPNGPICIHAAQGMGKGEYEDAAEFIEKVSGKPCPKPHELTRGAIIGTVEIVDGVTHSLSPWWMGPYGLVLANPRPVTSYGREPIRAKGELGFFDWQPSLEPWPDYAKWMLPKEAPVAREKEPVLL